MTKIVTLPSGKQVDLQPVFIQLIAEIEAEIQKTLCPARKKAFRKELAKVKEAAA
jgi:hypothetical protein